MGLCRSVKSLEWQEHTEAGKNQRGGRRDAEKSEGKKKPHPEKHRVRHPDAPTIAKELGVGGEEADYIVVHDVGE